MPETNFMESLQIMATTNPITGDMLVSKSPSKAYLDNYDLIFRKGNPKEEEKDEKREKNSRSQNDLHEGNS